MAICEVNVAGVCEEIQSVGRIRKQYQRSRIMIENRTRAAVATVNGYFSGDGEKERAKAFAEARAYIKRVLSAVKKDELDEMAEDEPIALFVADSYQGIERFKFQESLLSKSMEAMIKALPIIEWVEHEDQRGIGALSVALIIAETGDLANYANPAKVWRRMGCAPYRKGDENWMGGTWKKKPKGDKVRLTAQDWIDFGYNPKRRSVAYQIGDHIKMQNKGIYRQRFEEAKATYAKKHPDFRPARCDLHGMLVATKLALKNLWIAWNPDMAH